MLFNSIDFAIFLPLVLTIYWLARQRRIKTQNVILLVASYVFYGFWDWRFLTLIAISSLVDFLIGIGLSTTAKPRARKIMLLASIAVNLGFLGLFKYYNFFLANFVEVFAFFGKPVEANGIEIVLPVGISFYTFQTLSYSIDVYRGKIQATRDPIAFFAFVSFFPQLVAGPIERASNLLPQFSRPRTIRKAQFEDGLRQILWGFFKKVVIADNCATLVKQIFDNHESYQGSTLFLGGALFALQIYGDFSGYSDIAIGTARLFGFKLMRNFAFPYFSRNIAEFWRRWHISLSTWFRDYVYIPLGGSRGSNLQRIRNILIIFLVSGFWHGANWTYVVWGAINALYFLPSLLMGKNRQFTDTIAENSLLPSIKDAGRLLVTFSMTTLAWIYFRATTIGQGWEMTKSIFSKSLFTKPEVLPEAIIAGEILVLIVVEWLQRKKEHGLEMTHSPLPQPIRWTIYYGLAITILILGGREQEFIYFRF